MGWLRRFFNRERQPDENEDQAANDGADLEVTTARLEPPLDAITRPLPDRNLPPPAPKAHFTFGQASDQGKVRLNNQDAMLSCFFTSVSVDDRPDFGLFIVADGMGGHHDGEKASALAVRLVAQHVISSVYLPMLDSNTYMDAERPTIAEAMTTAVKLANERVLRSIPDGGTTLTAAAIMSDLAYFVHVGDSRAYIIRSEGISQVTRDHSLVQRMIEIGTLDPQDIDDHPQRNVLYRAIGQNEALEVDAVTRRLVSGSQILICSDGLWGLVRDEVLHEVVITASDPQAACDALIDRANAMGGSDNISVIVLKIPG